jgi:hypothetical protein
MIHVARHTDSSSLRAALAAGAVLVAFLMMILPRPAHSAEAVALGYEGYLGGLHMLSADVEIVRGEERYRMETVARGRGLVGWLLEWSSKAVTEGVIDADGTPRPVRHSRDIAQRGRTAKAIYIEYREDGVPLVARIRVGDEAKFTPFSERKGTMDPMSAVTAIMDQMAGGAPCAGKYAVFDGKERYDVTAKPGKPGTLTGNRYTMFSGEAMRCDLVLTPVDDQKKKLSGNPRARENRPVDEGSMKVTMWFASPVDGVSAVPVLASASTDYGGLRIYLTRAEKLAVPPRMQRVENR